MDKSIVKGKDEFGVFKEQGGVRYYKYGPDLLKKSFSRLARQISGSKDVAVKRGLPGYFEFGVFNGRATHTFANFVTKRHPDHKWNFYLFDSWQGLPETDDSRDVRAGWEEGTYTSNGPDYIKRRLRSAGIDDSRMRLVPGWFDASLTDELRREVSDRQIDPTFVCIDCDYYSSTIVALEWLRPLLKSGALFYFDDIWSYHGSPNKGELKAIHDFNAASSSEGLAVLRGLDISERMYIFWRDDDLYQAPTGDTEE